MHDLHLIFFIRPLAIHHPTGGETLIAHVSYFKICVKNVSLHVRATKWYWANEQINHRINKGNAKLSMISAWDCFASHLTEWSKKNVKKIIHKAHMGGLILWVKTWKIALSSRGAKKCPNRFTSFLVSAPCFDLSWVKTMKFDGGVFCLSYFIWFWCGFHFASFGWIDPGFRPALKRIVPRTQLRARGEKRLLLCLLRPR